jgi:hypothetical protein
VLGEQGQRPQEYQEQQKQKNDTCYYIDPEWLSGKKFEHAYILGDAIYDAPALQAL